MMGVRIKNINQVTEIVKFIEKNGFSVPMSLIKEEFKLSS